MRIFPPAAACAALFLCTNLVAQQAPEPAASAPRPARVGAEYTPGWDMMTPAERDAYREKMFAAPTKEECRRLRDEQVKQAARSARNRGIKDVPNARYDACE